MNDVDSHSIPSRQENVSDDMATKDANGTDSLPEKHDDSETVPHDKDDLENKYNALLKSQEVPDSYEKSIELADIDDDYISECSEQAKKIGLSQNQFEAYVKEAYQQKERDRLDKELESLDHLKEVLSEEAISRLSPEERGNLNAALKSEKEAAPLQMAVGTGSGVVDISEKKRAAYQEILAARRVADRNAEMKAFEKWKAYTKG